MRAMILAAGFGTRLRPLTALFPKPLIPLANYPILRYHIELLKAAGIREIMINLHHLPDEIPRALEDGSRFGVRLSYSREKEILGTGGGIRAAASFLREPGETFVVLNGDLLIDVRIEEVLQTHRQSAASATMVLREDSRADRFGAIGVGADGRILDFVGRARFPGQLHRRGLFTGIHVLEPEVLELIPEGKVCINQTAYPRMVREGRRVQAHFQKGFWSDVGTPERYLEASHAILSRELRPEGFCPFEEAAWAHDGSRSYGDGSRIQGFDPLRVNPPVLLGDDVLLEPEARLGPLTVVGDGALIGRGSRLEGCVIWPGVVVPPGTSCANTLLWGNPGECRCLRISHPLSTTPTD